MLIHWLSTTTAISFIPYVIIFTMFFADHVTKISETRGSTMRAMPFPFGTSPEYKKIHNFFYSISQVYATLEILTRPKMSSAFMVLFPIQIAAFFMTCVRKGIITAGGWHMLYTLALLSAYAYAMTSKEYQMTVMESILYHSMAMMFVVFRFVLDVDKYILWSVIVIAFNVRK
jgi:hypothetical protein